MSLPSSATSQRLRALAAEIDALGRDNVRNALDSEIARRAGSYLTGIEAYRRHPYYRPNGSQPVIWRDGTTRLLDYGRKSGGPVILVVPSLINRFHILDILPKLSFLRHLARRGLRPVVIDWDEPGNEELHFDLSDYIASRLEAAFDAVLGLAGAPVGILGYCMGGLLALALAQRRRDETACLALLATPWDFHAEGRARARSFGLIGDYLRFVCNTAGAVPIDMIQSLFFMLDPFTAERKFRRFAALDPDSEEARSFVALEDWVNDGVPLTLGVARECARSWYRDNDPAQGRWRVGGQTIEPKRLRIPALVVLPSRDRIVPPSSAEPLATELSADTVMRPPLGHVGMMSAARAPATLWQPIAEWLRAQIGQR